MSAAIAGGCLSALCLIGCSTPSPEPSSNGPRIIVSTPILGSIVSSIVDCAGSGSVQILMPNGSDPHDFAPSSAQLSDLVSADLVIVNGLGLEAGMSAALGSASADGARIWEAGPQVDPIPFGAGGIDPHIWFDMGRMANVATLVGQQLSEAGGSRFPECGSRVAEQIRDAEGEVRATLDAVPADRRVLVTDHEALGYLAAAYGYRIAGALIPSPSTLAQPSSAQLAELAALVRTEQVPAIFANVSSPAQLADAVAQESGTDVTVIPLYVESLGEPGTPAADYIGMMRENASRIASGLGASAGG